MRKRSIKDAWSTEEMRGVFNDAARMQRWPDVEAALAQAELGMIPERAAREIAAKSRYEAIEIKISLISPQSHYSKTSKRQNARISGCLLMANRAFILLFFLYTRFPW